MRVDEWMLMIRTFALPIVFSEEKAKGCFPRRFFSEWHFMWQGGHWGAFVRFVPWEQVARLSSLPRFRLHPPVALWFRFSLRRDSTGKRVSVKTVSRGTNPFILSWETRGRGSRFTEDSVVAEFLVQRSRSTEKRNEKRFWRMFPKASLDRMINHDIAQISRTAIKFSDRLRVTRLK